MNDSILFLALATVFGAAMFIVGWAVRESQSRSDYMKGYMAYYDVMARVRDHPDPVDSAGA